LVAQIRCVKGVGINRCTIRNIASININTPTILRGIVLFFGGRTPLKKKYDDREKQPRKTYTDKDSFLLVTDCRRFGVIPFNKKVYQNKGARTKNYWVKLTSSVIIF